MGLEYEPSSEPLDVSAIFFLRLTLHLCLLTASNRGGSSVTGCLFALSAYQNPLSLDTSSPPTPNPKPHNSTGPLTSQTYHYAGQNKHPFLPSTLSPKIQTPSPNPWFLIPVTCSPLPVHIVRLSIASDLQFTGDEVVNDKGSQDESSSCLPVDVTASRIKFPPIRGSHEPDIPLCGAKQDLIDPMKADPIKPNP